MECRKCHAELVEGINISASRWKEQSKICKVCDSNNAKKNNKKYRELVIEHYSHGTNSCAICGAKTYLEIDHANKDGTEHRKLTNMGSGATAVKWLIHNGFPEGFRILCAACNNLAKYTDDSGILQHYESMSIMTKESLDSH